MRPYLATLLLSVLVLSACDSGGPDFDDHPLVGSWMPESSAQRSFAVVNQTQQIVDQRTPGTGTLRFMGDAASDLRYPTFVSRDGEQITVFTIDTHFHPFPDRYAFLNVNEHGTSVTAWSDGEYVQYSRPHPYGEPPHTYEDGRFEVETLTLQSSHGDTVTVRGSLDVPLRTLEAGTEYEVETHIHTADTEDLAYRYVFEPEGRFRAEPLLDSDRPGYGGSWEEVEDGRIQLTTETQDPPITVELDYAIDDGALVLSTSQTRCESRPVCLAQYENQNALIEGSLTHVRQTNEIAFSRMSRGG